ncbi:uncharacterized protein LOC110026455 [Phalaenopsis equestris]|uniref:uncharacterized protein LOC110026455 n=1 Tax=Phalaenopsis equestris TaxID=78828 RepID=UPI0009E5B033|nr:uncharacterized protein LOC110026455 [Phalaenopsis equestris]
MDRSEPHWRVNSSFSPPSSRRWDCRDQPDGLSQEIPAAPLYGSSLSSHSKGSRSVMSGDQYGNHHHSVSDGALSYFESPSNNLQASRWTPPVQRYDLGEFSTPTRGARIDSTASPQSSDRQFTARVSPTSHSLFSPSPLTESSRWGASSSKHPTFLPSRNFPGRRSFMSTPVYPLVFHNPVSDGESSGITGASSSHRMLPSDHSRNSPPWPETTLNPDLKFHKALSDLQKVGVSPDTDSNSRREGIRWSNGSSNDFAFDGHAVDIAEDINVEKCGLCYRLLQQKSPWSLHEIIRNIDLPIAGVLPCGHVFHAECLEETTPKSLVQEPPCPLCLNLINHEGSDSFSEPLQVALRTPRRMMRVGMTSRSNRNNIDLRRNLSQPLRASSSIRSRLRKRLSFKISRDLFGAKIFRRI